MILDLYFVFIPSLLKNPFLQFAGLLAFFPLAFFVTKWVGLGGLKGIGLVFHRGWLKNFFLSFCIGFLFWLLMYGIQFLSGDLEWVGIRKSSEILMPLLIILVGFFMGSFINDLIFRGYVISFLQDKLPIGWVFTISIFIYALDDYWYAGFSLSNLLFSVILGLSLTYAFYKTGSIWANTGIHYGLNVAYGLFFGMVGNPGTSIMIVKESVNQTTTIGAISHYLIPAIMFLFLLIGMKFYHKNTNQNNNKLPFSA
ncbi:CPBP family intramembrane glutamic endopeptidase [Bacillus sp. MRMR6]|uniref:CPBP family intramembrane glutamic endopeptidase n=1 Tax=Bacillus sp. MRMR6 TaxID=1928617 RepID=UPI0011150CAB|nr:type II CAAX endopeptidase family protein [Bacillus sp. MRMR6]